MFCCSGGSIQVNDEEETSTNKTNKKNKGII